MVATTEKKQEFPMGFIPCDKPLTQKGEARELVSAFVKSGNDCVYRRFADEKEAKKYQGVISAYLRSGEDMGVKIKRNMDTVWLIKEDI